jgi:hypothetical protein
MTRGNQRDLARAKNQAKDAVSDCALFVALCEVIAHKTL